MRSSPILAGLRVVELSAFVAAPLAGATLAALGAEVVRVDPIRGGIDVNRWPLHNGRSLYWAGLNQGKRSLTVDLNADAGRQLVSELVTHAGTLITNLPARGWASFESLSRVRSDLVMAVITGASDGSAAVDYTVNAAVGFPWVTGPTGWSGPVNHVLPAWDALAGYLLVAGVLAAELHRRATGEGQLVTVSLTDVALAVVSHLGLIGEAELNSEARPRLGNHLFGSFARDFVTRDGRHIIIVALTPRQWSSLVDATGLRSELDAIASSTGANLDAEGERYGLREEIASTLESWFAMRDFDEVSRVLELHSVLWAPYQTFKELARDRRVTENPLFAIIDQPGIGRYHTASSPLVFTGTGRVPPTRAPRLGEDGAQVLASWLGYSPNDIEGAKRDGVIGDGQLTE